jgi:hypothetical protein
MEVLCNDCNKYSIVKAHVMMDPLQANFGNDKHSQIQEKLVELINAEEQTKLNINAIKDEHIVFANKALNNI